MGFQWPASMRLLAQAAPWLLFTSPRSTSIHSAGLPKTDIDTSVVPRGTCWPRVRKVGQAPSTYPAAASIVSPANCDTSIASYMTSAIRNGPHVPAPVRQAPGYPARPHAIQARWPALPDEQLSPESAQLRICHRISRLGVLLCSRIDSSRDHHCCRSCRLIHGVFGALHG